MFTTALVFKIHNKTKQNKTATYVIQQWKDNPINNGRKSEKTIHSQGSPEDLSVDTWKNTHH